MFAIFLLWDDPREDDYLQVYAFALSDEELAAEVDALDEAGVDCFYRRIM